MKNYDELKELAENFSGEWGTYIDPYGGRGEFDEVGQGSIMTFQFIDHEIVSDLLEDVGDKFSDLIENEVRKTTQVFKEGAWFANAKDEKLFSEILMGMMVDAMKYHVCNQHWIPNNLLDDDDYF